MQRHYPGCAESKTAKSGDRISSFNIRSKYVPVHQVLERLHVLNIIRYHLRPYCEKTGIIAVDIDIVLVKRYII